MMVDTVDGGALPVMLGAAASGATLLGGLIGLRLAERIVLVLGLSAGVVLGVALFDLLPEALDLARTAAAPGGSPRGALAWVAAGIGGYMLFERVLGGAGRTGRWRAHLGPATLTLHSLFDGLGIGLAFHVSLQVGGLVALAVLTHDLADGVNVVSLCLAAGRRAAARGWLLANGLAPLAGVVAGLALHPPERLLAGLLGLFAGGFLYLGACELVPRSYALDPRPRTTLASLAGMALMFAVSMAAR